MESSRRKLDRQTLKQAARTLADRDSVLNQILADLGPPPLWKRPATLASFVRIILEQQVSLASAKSTFDRFVEACGPKVTPESVLRLDTDGLKSCGFSRQKSRYTLALAADVLEKRFVIGRLRHLSDDDAKAQITQRLGMGDWTADVFLMMSLLRPDIFPTGDLALVNGMRELDSASYRDADSLVGRAECWRPFRSVATRMIWQSYLHRRNKTIP